MATGKAIIYKGIPYFSDVKVPTRVSQLANDAGYVTTDEKVKQTPNTTSLDSHPILFSASDDNGEVVGGTYKNPDFYYNPSLNRMIFKNGGGIEVRSGAASVSVLSQYILLSDPTDAHSIMNITANDIELDDVTSQGTTYSNTWDGTHHSLKGTIGSLVSKTGDTISGYYINTADFSESGVYGKRVTTYGPWGIDVEEYVATSLWSRLSLRDSDILLTKTWDGTNTSLKSAISAIKKSLSDLGTFYTYRWTAGSSNAYGQQLTQKLTLPKGVYILIGVSPVISVNECAIALTSNKTMNAPFVFNIVRTRTPLAYTFQITEDNTDVWIMSGGSASITYTAIGDASGRIIRVG